ncbi:hypothetical protein MYAM1_003031 [Malassezia yamatoensis]|uniref:Uncharacterized protein n=1 Tax=Malassezia yamatoensis TaxID=253288 RepID=A0AAJ5YZC3_9BASI|nr:hypothetical protein MYAM1_003031 [Malassezia yamatoensis]
MLVYWGVALSCVVHLVTAADSSAGYVNPANNNGKQITQPKEPLNVIISGQSDSYALSTEGFESYYRAIGFDVGTCGGQSSNDTQKANLGDGKGYVNQTGIARWGNGCIESLTGGNHFRYWVQNGSKAASNAYFLAASVEYPIKQDHMIVPGGYDLGRDWLLGNATQGTKTDQETGNQFETSYVKNDTSLLKGISASSLNHNIGTDGKVAVILVKVTQKGNGSSNTQDVNSGQEAVTSTLSIIYSIAIAALVALVSLA